MDNYQYDIIAPHKKKSKTSRTSRSNRRHKCEHTYDKIVIVDCCCGSISHAYKIVYCSKCGKIKETYKPFHEWFSDIWATAAELQEKYPNAEVYISNGDIKTLADAKYIQDLDLVK